MVGKGPMFFMYGLVDNDGLYKLLGSTLISSVCDATTSTNHTLLNAPREHSSGCAFVCFVHICILFFLSMFLARDVYKCCWMFLEGNLFTSQGGDCYDYG